MSLQEETQTQTPIQTIIPIQGSRQGSRQGSNLIDIDLNDDLPMCRICYETTNQNEMLHPCFCKGTSKYIHRTCLNQWRSLSPNPKAATHCSECQFEYRTQASTFVEKPICEKLGRCMVNNTFPFFMLNNLIIIAFSYILLGVDKNKRMRDRLSNNDTIGYYSWSLIIYSSSIILAFLIRFIFVKNKSLYINYYLQKLSVLKVILALSGLILSIFIDIFLTSLISTIFIQIFIKWHFDSIARINNANDDTILNYNGEQEEIV